jgi:hypothetical protein
MTGGPPIERCDGPACRLRARDLGLLAGVGRLVACLGRCDVPVAAVAGGRALTIRARGRIEPATVTPLPPQTGAPVLLRDAALADQPTLAAARRRGAWRALATLAPASARESVARLGPLPGAAQSAEGAQSAQSQQTGGFGGRVLCERDPHLVLQGAAVVARGDATPHLAVRVPAAWSVARAAVERAAADARAADLIGDLALDRGVEPVAAARLARAAELGADWYDRHPTRLCAVSGDVLRPGLYELPADARAADAIAAAGGAVAGLLVAAVGYVLCDGETTTDTSRPAPAALVVFHAGREPAIC